jgi:glycerophosphoryl diester phosphodiesterase
VRAGRLPFGCRIAGPSMGLVRLRPNLVRAVRTAGRQVYVWTVNALPDLELLIDTGVDGIITDRPRFVLDHLDRLDRVGG